MITSVNNKVRKTKIVCTLGPASLKEDVIEDMLRSGMNIARFNFSHGSHEYHKEGIELFRRVRDRLKLPAAVLLDTKGPEGSWGLWGADARMPHGRKSPRRGCMCRCQHP